jgi:hypothetical protein
VVRALFDRLLALVRPAPPRLPEFYRSGRSFVVRRTPWLYVCEDGPPGSTGGLVHVKTQSFAAAVRRCDELAAAAPPA